MSSERRDFIPIGYFKPDTLASNKLRIVPHATPYHFGVLSSSMHMAWVRYVTGRLKSDYQYSVHIVYNNFPWPTGVPEDKRRAITQGADAVLAARVAHPGSTLADLYDPDAMPDDLRAAHHTLDKAVDAAYAYRGGKDDSARVAFLFTLYQKLLADLLPAKATARHGKRKRPITNSRDGMAQKLTPDRNAIITLSAREFGPEPMVRGALFVYPTSDGFGWVESGYLDPYGSPSPQVHVWEGTMTNDPRGFICNGERGEARVVGIDYANRDSEAVRCARRAFEEARRMIEAKGHTLSEEREELRKDLGEPFS